MSSGCHVALLFVTGPLKIGHVGTNYVLLHNRTYLSTGITYLHSETCIVMPINYLISAEKFKAIA